MSDRKRDPRQRHGLKPRRPRRERPVPTDATPSDAVVLPALLPALWDDLDAWRIYADRLIDLGDPHGELIALEFAEDPTLAFERLQADVKARPEAYEDVGKWLFHPTAVARPGQGVHAPGVQVEISAYGISLTLRYGYIAAATVRDTRHLETLLTSPAAWAMTELTVRLGFAGAVETLHAHAPPRLASLRAICTGVGAMSGSVARALLAGDGLPGVRELLVEGADVSAYAEALIASSMVPELQRLMLRGGRLTPEAVAILAEGWVALHALDALDLTGLQGPVRSSPALSAFMGERVRF